LDYFHRLIQLKAKRPSDDLLTELTAVETEGDRLSAGELLSMALLLLVAGHETTTNLLGMGTWVLMRHPEAVPTSGGWGTAIEELLRYTSPVQLDARMTTADVTLSGHAIPQGSVVMVSLGAANRDPAIFANPDGLVMDRTPNPHLAFGRGIHVCLGAALARLEAQIALPDLLSRGTPPMPAGDLVWNDNLVLRGLAALPVTFGA
jgi:cytochrome P450 PksS